MWRARYERNAMTEQQLTDDPDCLGGLSRTVRPPDRVKRSYSYEYRFSPDQETKLHQGSKCLFAHDLTRTCPSVQTFNATAGLLTIKLTGADPPGEAWIDSGRVGKPSPNRGINCAYRRPIPQNGSIALSN